jgi:phage gp16-like protein
MRSRATIKEDLSEMTFDELHRYKAVLLRNKDMGVSHLEDMGMNDLQLEITQELIKESFNSDWNYTS